MSDVNESVHVITFDPELTENQRKAMEVAVNAAYMGGRMDECSLTMELLDGLAEQFAEEADEGDDGEVNHMFVTFCGMLLSTLDDHFNEMFEESREIGVNGNA